MVRLVAARGEDPEVVEDLEEEEELHMEENLTGEVVDSVVMEVVATINFEFAFSISPAKVTIYF